MTECIYHKDKVTFDGVSMDLRKARLIPKTYSARLAMAVCSCRRKRATNDSDVALENITTLKSAVSEEIALPKWEGFSETKTFVKNLANKDFPNDSEINLLKVVYDALQGKFEKLIAEMKVGNDRRNKERRSGKVTPRVFHMMIKRKQRSCPVIKELVLPMFGGNSKYLEETTGKGFCLFGKAFDCVIRLDGDKTQEYMNKNVQKTVVKVWCKSPESLSQINGRLLSITRLIQAKKDEARVVQIECRRNRSRRSTVNEFDHNVYDHIYVKESMSNDFDKKSSKDRKHNLNRLVNKPQSSPLNGGHCLYCLQNFDTKLSGDNDCVYHSGYIVTNPYNPPYTWSCCRFQAKSIKPSPSDHVSGCCTGRHNWRPHQRASRREKSVKMYMQHILKRK